MIRYHFEQFGGRKSTKGNLPYIKIHKHGNISLKGSFLRQFVNANDYVTFFFDEENRAIGMRFHGNRTPYCYKVVKPKGNGTCGQVGCPSFLRYFKILPPETYECKVHGYNKAHKVVIVRLKDKIEDEPKPERVVKRYHVPIDQPQGKGFMVDKMLRPD